MKLLCVVALLATVVAAWAGEGQGRNTKADVWAKEVFGKDGRVPFSFTYGGKPSADIIGTWRVSRESKRIDENKTAQTLVYTDPATGLRVRCEVVHYNDFPTVEWTLYFKNTGKADTPIIEDIQAIDHKFLRGRGEFVLHHEVGSLMSANDFQPFETKLGPGEEKSLATSGGRPCNANMPYFNIAWADGGVIVVVGWPGQWSAKFTTDQVRGLTVEAGQEQTHFTLHPGEEVRGPLMVVQFYDGDWMRGQNIWRRWMIAHNTPKPGGKPAMPTWKACSSHQFGEMIHANTENQKEFVDRYIEEGLKTDYWWMDAGWYINDGTWVNVGTWEVDKKRFPNGLRAVSDHARAKGVKTLVWFEPERVTKNSWLYDNRPQWLLTPADLPDHLKYQNDWRLLNLGNLEARKWLINHIDGILKNERIDLYRQDFNMDPLYFWRANDTPDRQGITEIGHIEGYLAYWDELRRRHPNMLIDSCASGGRRNDLETLRRAVPFVRSDHLFEPNSQQCHMYGMSLWIPSAGTGVGDRESLKKSAIYANYWKPGDSSTEIPSDTYLFRSAMAPHLTACYDMRDRNIDYDTLRKLVNEWRQLNPNYYGDFYPLTPYSLENNVWMAWQFDRPEAGQGMVQAFRRVASEESSRRFSLRGLDEKSNYLVTDLDTGREQVLRGRELMGVGLEISITRKQEAALISYKKTR